jgi:chemotaxis protein methyltransferase CheR
MSLRATQFQPEPSIPALGGCEFAFTDRDYRRIAAMVHADSGIDLKESKSALVYSRLAKRLRALQLESFRDYCDLIEAEHGREERLEMLSALTTNVTRFFRERHHFEHLESQALPSLVAAARKGKKVRIWSAGCSTGQEPYSIALSLLSVEPGANRLDVKILATDIDPRVIAAGGEGVFPEAMLTDVPPPLRARYFSRAGADRASWRIADEAKKLISFRALNLNADWPMRGLFHVIFCRNVVIYFDAEAQNALWRRLAAKMEPGGWLYIGHSERVTGPANSSLRGAGVTTTYRLAATRIE